MCKTDIVLLHIINIILNTESYELLHLYCLSISIGVQLEVLLEGHWKKSSMIIKLFSLSKY